MLIGVSGDIRAGKDLVGKMIQYLSSHHRDDNSFENWLYGVESGKLSPCSSFEIKKFADKLKEMVCIILNCTRAQLEDRDFKEKQLGEEWRRWRLELPHAQGKNRVTLSKLFSSEAEAWDYNSERLDYSVSVCRVYSELLTPRLLMQLLGTDCGRNIIHPDIWVNSTLTEYIPGKSNWVITDTRFINEGNSIYQKKGIVLSVVRPETDNKDRSSLHESETALDNFKFTGVLNNTKDLYYLLDQVKEYVN